MDLSNVQSDEYWLNKKSKLNLHNQTDCDTLAKLIKDKLPGLGLIDLSRNKLRFTNQFAKLIEYVPDITYISLESNNFDREYDVSNTFGRLKKLNGIILTNNPISDNKSVSELAPRLKRNGRFPALTSINGEDIPEGIGFDIQVSGLDTADQVVPEDALIGIHEEHKNLAEPVQGFLEDFVGVNNDESSMKGQNLLPFYHDNCAVSISTQRLPKHFDAEECDISHLFSKARNLRIESKQTSIRRGKLQAVSLFTELPNLKANLESVAFEVVNMFEDIVHIAMNGKLFEEGNGKNGGGKLAYYNRNFQRQIIIKEDKSAQNKYGFTIINDMLMICARKPEKNEKSAQNGQSDSSLAQQLAGEKKPSQNDMLVQFMTDSKLKMQYAKECLEQAKWNYTEAGNLFMKMKPNIPPNYFQ